MLGMALAGLFTIVLRAITLVAIQGDSMIASLVFYGLIACILVFWCLYFRLCLKASFESQLEKFELVAPSEGTGDESLLAGDDVGNEA